ncbi:MAG TPA: hypothetical protein VGI16_09575 [Candidatus Acidoferrum sp.]|jgi:Spy/CpxP family protein refolding chaperone
MTETNARRRAALWVGAVFLLGAALGGVFGFLFARHSVSAASAPLTEPQRRAHRVEQLTKELGLTSAQSAQLDATLTHIHSDYKSVHQQSEAQLDAARQRGRDQIRSILTDEQKPKFEEFLKKMDEERKKNAAAAQK